MALQGLLRSWPPLLCIFALCLQGGEDLCSTWAPHRDGFSHHILPQSNGDNGHGCKPLGLGKALSTELPVPITVHVLTSFQPLLHLGLWWLPLSSPRQQNPFCPASAWQSFLCLNSDCSSFTSLVSSSGKLFPGPFSVQHTWFSWHPALCLPRMQLSYN